MKSLRPNGEIGKVIARIAQTGVINQFNLGENMSVVEFEIPERWIDQNLISQSSPDIRNSSRGNPPHQ